MQNWKKKLRKLSNKKNKTFKGVEVQVAWAVYKLKLSIFVIFSCISFSNVAFLHSPHKAHEMALKGLKLRLNAKCKITIDRAFFSP